MQTGPNPGYPAAPGAPYPGAHPQGGYPQGGYPPGGAMVQAQPATTYSPHGPAPPPMYSVNPWQPGAGDRPMYDGPDMPSQDLAEDHSVPEPLPMVPDVSKLDRIGGYEHTGYHAEGTGGAPAIPPPAYGAVVPDQAPPEEFSSVTHITEEQARQALLEHTAQHCCYGKGAAQTCHISKITPSSALHYTLLTYTESRSTSWEQEPYIGQPVDGPQNGPAPPPWSIACSYQREFQKEIGQFEVPHTASVKQCHGCMGMGWLRCHGCFGRGFRRCNWCHGSGREWKTDAHGHRHHESCWHCHGTGRKRCFTCGGDGRVICKTCRGYRNLKVFIKLTVLFEPHMAEHVIEKTDMPDQLVKKVGGEEVFSQQLPRVFPIMNYPDGELCMAVKQLIDDQASRFQACRIIVQKQTLRAVPVSEVSSTFKNKDFRFWVYGNERQVHAPDYPQKCCCGCVIL